MPSPRRGRPATALTVWDGAVGQEERAAVLERCRNNGLVCLAPSRFYIHEKIRKEFTEGAVELTRKLKIGNGLEEGVQGGPMFEPRALEKTAGLIDDARGHGAKVLTGGGRSTRVEKGFWFEPTVSRNVSREMRILTEEPIA